MSRGRPSGDAHGDGWRPLFAVRQVGQPTHRLRLVLRHPPLLLHLHPHESDADHSRLQPRFRAHYWHRRARPVCLHLSRSRHRVRLPLVAQTVEDATSVVPPTTDEADRLYANGCRHVTLLPLLAQLSPPAALLRTSGASAIRTIRMSRGVWCKSIIVSAMSPAYRTVYLSILAVYTAYSIAFAYDNAATTRVV